MSRLGRGPNNEYDCKRCLFRSLPGCAACPHCGALFGTDFVYPQNDSDSMNREVRDGTGKLLDLTVAAQIRRQRTRSRSPSPGRQRIAAPQQGSSGLATGATRSSTVPSPGAPSQAPPPGPPPPTNSLSWTLAASQAQLAVFASTLSRTGRLGEL